MRKPLLAFLLLSFCLVAVANGQGTASRVTGTVVDEKGSVVPGAVVTLTNEATQTTLTTETSNGGTYVFDSIQVGQYTVSVEKQGFKKAVSVGNTANINQPVTVDFTLEVGGLSETVQIVSSAATVQTSSSGNMGNTVEQRTLVTLPIVGNRGRNPLEFINFQPGVVTGANTGGGIHVHGSRDRAFNFTLDGIDINETSAGGSNFTPIRTNPDSIQEFQVVTGNFTADLGRSSGAQVTLVTKSGSNDFHGSVFEFFQTPRFHANEYNNTINRVGRPQFVQNIFGGSLGGPVYLPRFGEGGPTHYNGKNKTFFFTNIQFLRTSQSFFVNRTVYTQQARSGIYRYVVGGVNRNASQTSPSVDANGNPLPGLTIGSYNVLANSGGLGFDPTTQFIIGFTPLPNNFNVGDGLNVGGFGFVAPQTERQYDFTTKIDHYFNDRHSVYVRWAHGAQNTLGDNANGGLQKFPGIPNFVDTYRTPRNMAVNYRWTISPTVVNEFVTGFNRFTFSFNNPDPRENPPVILNVPNDPLNLEEPINNLRTITTWQFVDNLSWIRNTHAFKFGTNLRFQKHVDDRSAVAGVLTRERIFLGTGVNPVPASFRTQAGANTLVPGINAADRTRLDSTINDLLGRVGTINQAFVAISDNQFGPGRTRFNYAAQYPEFDFFAQDTWKVNRNLTLDLGVRWEMRLSPRSPNNIVLRPEQRIAVGEPATNSFKFGEGKLYDDALYLFAPTVGIAWDPKADGKSSIRANYRLAYDRTNTFLFSSFIFQSAPGLTRAVTNNTFGQNGGLLRQGVPTLNSNDVTPLQFRQPPSFSTNSLNVVDPELSNPRTHQYSVSYQREIGGKNVLEINYIGRLGRDLYSGYDVNQVDINKNGFLADFELLRTTGNSARINQLLAGHSGLTLVNGVRETGSQFLLRQSLAGPVRLANGTTTTNLVAAGAVAQAAFIVAQSTQGSFAAQPGAVTLIANGFSPFFFQPYPQFTGAVNVIENNDRSRYNALEIQVSRRASKGLAFQASYTLAKSEDTRSFDPAFTLITRGGTGQSAANTPFDINNRELNYARSDFDRRHALQGYVVYDLPFGKGRRFGTDWGRTTDFWLGGFNIASVMRYYSGRPFTVFSGSNTLSQVVFTPASCDGCTPDLGSVVLENGRNVFFTAEQRAKFFVPAAGEVSNVGRNFFTGPTFFNLDMTFGKRFRFTESKDLEVRMELQNVTNTPSFAVPDANLILTSGSFGQILGNTTSTSRKMQFVAKFNF
ncbi:MAG TPA: carboxypeptidase regulatory-like domain-containing protein [Pyrinomonadaceae bacterium]|nr:carboxypeptidase regulatory-like domain-containing protein [Pyrinomonadaceae bacterium]